MGAIDGDAAAHVPILTAPGSTASSIPWRTFRVWKLRPQGGQSLTGLRSAPLFDWKGTIKAATPLAEGRIMSDDLHRDLMSLKIDREAPAPRSGGKWIVWLVVLAGVAAVVVFAKPQLQATLFK